MKEIRFECRMNTCMLLGFMTLVYWGLKSHDPLVELLMMLGVSAVGVAASAFVVIGWFVTRD